MKHSPLHERHRSLNATFGEFSGWTIPFRYADLDEEVRAVRSGAGMVDLSYRGKLELTGRDRTHYLHNMCTNDILKLATGQDGSTFGKGKRYRAEVTPEGPGCYAAIVTRQGKMVADFKLKMLERSLILDCEPAALIPVKDHLEKFIIMEECAVKDVTDEFVSIGVHGPRSLEVLEGVLDRKIDSRPEFWFLRHSNILVQRFRFTGGEGWEVMAPVSEAGDLWKALTDAGARPMGWEALEVLRVENGFPRWGADTDDSVLPMEAGLESIAMSYTKGCYMGQEVIQRVETYGEVPKRLWKLSCDGRTLPLPGFRIDSADGKEVGHVTSSVFSPMAQRPIALGYLHKSIDKVGARVTIRSGTDPISATVLDLPYTTTWSAPL